MFNALYPNIIIITSFILLFGYKLLRGNITFLHFFYWIIFSVYIANVVVYTLFPFPYQKELIEIMIEDNLGVKHNFIPFMSFIDAIDYGSFAMGLKQIGGNILLFMPLGFAVPILFPGIKTGKVILIGFIISVSIELIQAIVGFFLGYNYRSFDIDDLLMNTLGTVIGVLLFSYLSNFLKKSGLLINKNIS